jgi:aryl-alcohol dehydrogenase-like predicted oxidoreductase
MGALAQAVHQGKALYAGISNCPADRTREVAKNTDFTAEELAKIDKILT